MPGYQILVKFLDGKTRCLQFPCSSVTDGDLKSRIHALAGIPVEEQRLVTGTREVGVAETLEAGPDGVFPSCTLLLRLRGGKGGFGSLLRGAATKAGQKKTSNFDACRDMSGRRLRHVNAEKKLKEWKAEAQERELEKTAEEYLKKLQKVKKEDSGIMEEMKVIREKSERARESVELAVKSGLAEAKKQMEQKAEAVKVGTKRKLPYLSFPTDDSEDSDEDEDDESGDEENLSTPPKPLPSLHEDDESGDEENLSTPPKPLPRLTETSSCQL